MDEQGRPETGRYAVGDRFGQDDGWLVRAIDHDNARSIISFAAYNVELVLFDQRIAMARDAVSDPAPRGPRPTSFTVDRRSEAAVRAELFDQGLSVGEINELLDIASRPQRQRAPRAPSGDDTARTGDAPPGDEARSAEAAGEIDDSAAGLDMILKLLQSDPTKAAEEERRRAGLPPDAQPDEK